MNDPRERVTRQEGASAVVVAIALLLLFGAGAIAIDLGSAWETKRELISDTDAAALAGAAFLEELPQAAHVAECAVAGNDANETTSATYTRTIAYLNDNRDTSDPNDPTFQLLDFDVECNGPGRTGRVTVAAERQAQQTFAPAIGLGPVVPEAESVAQYGDITGLGGLRPFGACFVPGDPTRTDPHVQSWINAIAISPDDPASSPAYLALKGSGDIFGPWDTTLSVYTGPDGSIDYPGATGGPATYNQSAYGGYGVIHRVYFNHDFTDGCGTGTGNWGTICFIADTSAGYPCGSGAIEDYIRDGFSGQVSLGGTSTGDEDCDFRTPGATEACASKTGQFPGSNDQDELKQLIDNETLFSILLFDASGGSGTTATYHPSAFLAVKLRGYGPVKTNGAGAGVAFTATQEDRYLDFEFSTATFTGTIGNAGGAATGIRGVALCGVDGDTAGSRCTAP